MTVVAYDLPVKDLVDALSATGHVTHTPYRKTSVTLHHNGGRLSHEGVLNVWRTREASAHFDVDSIGAVAQYVKVNEYAWAVGNTDGNMSTISIEQANITVAPSWTVAPATWHSAARLAGWLFARVIGVRPNSGNFFVHSHWSSTDCAGPSTRASWNPIMAAAQAAYDAFTGTPNPPPSRGTPRTPIPTTSTAGQLAVDGDLGPATIRRWQQVMGTPIDGVISPVSSLVKAVQARLNREGAGLNVDGVGIVQDGQVYKTVAALQRHLRTPEDGRLSRPTSTAVKALQTRLNTGTF